MPLALRLLRLVRYARFWLIALLLVAVMGAGSAGFTLVTAADNAGSGPASVRDGAWVLIALRERPAWFDRLWVKSRPLLSGDVVALGELSNPAAWRYRSILATCGAKLSESRRPTGQIELMRDQVATGVLLPSDAVRRWSRELALDQVLVGSRSDVSSLEVVSLTQVVGRVAFVLGP